MKSEEDEYISTANQLQPVNAATEDVRRSPADISPESVSKQPVSHWVIGPPTCRRATSISLVEQCSDDYQVLQGLMSIKSEDQPAETHVEDRFLPFNKTCHKRDRRPTDYCEPHIQVKSEKVESDECNSDSGEPRKWVVCEGGLLKEVLKVEPTGWSVETLKLPSESFVKKEQHKDDSVSEIREVNLMPTKAGRSSVCTKQFAQSNSLNDHEQISTGEKQRPCTSYKNLLIYTIRITPHAKSLLKPSQQIRANKQYICSTCGKAFRSSANLMDHEHFHAGIKPYTCHTCGKSFTQCCNLKVHERTHITVKPYTCSRCGKSFTQLWYLKVHERRHTGVKPYFYSTW